MHMEDINNDALDEMKSMLINRLGDKERVDINGKVIKAIYKQDGEIFVEDTDGVSRTIDNPLMICILNIDDIKNKE